jgi:UDP-3-O-[3-hydroxymyristoyl] glucosamine N-acyltransferase
LELLLSDINTHVNGEIIGDKNLIIRGVSEINESVPDTITFLANPLYKKYLKSSNAAAFFVRNIRDLEDKNGIVIDNPQLAVAITLKLFHPKIKRRKAKNSSSQIDESAKIGKNVIIESGAIIGPGVIIGDGSEIGSNSVILDNTILGNNCKLYPNVTLYHNLILGSNIIIHSGSVIGADGFGFVKEKETIIKIPQVGNVIIGDNVEVGSNCSVDRGTIGSTIIGDLTKIDNLVHIAHNVKIGKSCFITAQVGIAGSTIIGDNCSFGGQSGVVSHIKIGSNSLISAKSGVTKSLVGNNTYGGFPIKKIKDFHKREALIGQLELMKNKLFKINNKEWKENKEQ